MGNSNGRESRPDVGPGSGDPYSRSYRHGRPDMGLLSLASSSSRNREREDQPFVHKETRAEREARKREKEHQLRLKERERSLKEESIDGGYLVTLGVYTGVEDYSRPVVRQLQV